MKLRRFQKEKHLNGVMLSLGVFAVILSLLIGMSYAEYKSESEVTFINAKVRFPYANEIAYETSGSDVTNIEQALNELYERLGN